MHDGLKDKIAHHDILDTIGLEKTSHETDYSSPLL